MSVSGTGSDDFEARAQRVDRLTTLQRLREQAEASGRKSMLRTVEEMIQAELKALHLAKDRAEARSKSED